MASTPASTEARASASEVAVASNAMPADFSREMVSGDGRPKWKLTTGGRVSSSMASMSGSATKLV
jgi:hypothetical protein